MNQANHQQATSRIISVLAGCWLAAGLQLRAASYEPASVTPPALQREMRAAWVASVGNIDWPSTNAFGTAQQKAELLAILERAVQLKLNTILLQVRPACDALYPSSLEPWSEYLTGTMGKAPEPYYDPLLFAIEEAHRRGLELHAWFNPFRARHLAARSPIASKHISRTHPELVRQYGNSLWLDPGEKQVQEHSLRVVMDVVKRYDLDGVHFDDYFYPYPEHDAAGKELDFPDEASWRRYGSRSRMSREEWRRDNINRFVSRTYQSIKVVKPWVKFGISPFGIWRPGNPAQIRGFDAYAKLYADSRQWLNQGWLDYVAPQLYWSIDGVEQSFPVLLRWWSEQNSKGRLLVSGMDSTKVGRRWGSVEIVNQIRIGRNQGANGHIHWDMKALMRNGVLVSALERETYQQPALVPATPWLRSVASARPKVTLAVRAGSGEASWFPAKAAPVWLWVVQTRNGKDWSTRVLPGERRSLTLPSPPPEVIAVSAVDRYGDQSKAASCELRR